MLVGRFLRTRAMERETHEEGVGGLWSKGVYTHTQLLLTFLVVEEDVFDTRA